MIIIMIDHTLRFGLFLLNVVTLFLSRIKNRWNLTLTILEARKFSTRYKFCKKRKKNYKDIKGARSRESKSKHTWGSNIYTDGEETVLIPFRTIDGNRVRSRFARKLCLDVRDLSGGARETSYFLLVNYVLVFSLSPSLLVSQ